MTQPVITGLGPVTPIGIGVDDFFEGLANEKPPPAAIPDFSLADYVDATYNYLDRASELALAATALAIEDAGLDPAAVAAESTGLVIGSAYGCAATADLFFADVVSKGPRYAKPILFPHAYHNTTASLVAIQFDLHGFHANIAAGPDSSTHALIKAIDLLAMGKCNIVLAGGFDACPDGEAAAMLVLESLAHATTRNAHIYATLSDQPARNSTPFPPLPLNAHGATTALHLIAATAHLEQHPDTPALSTPSHLTVGRAILPVPTRGSGRNARPTSPVLAPRLSQVGRAILPVQSESPATAKPKESRSALR